MTPTFPTTPGQPDAGSPTILQDREGISFDVRLFQPGDREGLQGFYEAFEPKRAAQGLPPQGAERVARWLDTVLSSGIHLVVTRCGELIGHGLLVPTSREDVSEYAVFLRQDVRGRGMGTQLNRVAVETARAAGIRRLWLSVEPHNRSAVRSYEKVGFQFLPGAIFSLEAEMELEL